VRSPPNQWTDTIGSQGVLFFAQLMREMLTDQTFESFRAYTMDTISRLDETISIAEDVRLRRVPRAALDPVQDELSWSLNKDPVAEDIVKDEIDALVLLGKGSHVSLDSVSRHVTFIKKRLGRYKELCEKKILELFSEEKKRIALRRTAGFYCSHLINIGYSKNYILRCVESAFFQNPMRRVGQRTLLKFFRNFDNEIREYMVYVAVDADFGKFLSRLGVPVYSSSIRIPANLSREVNNHMPITNEEAYIIVDEHAYDEDSAVAQVDARLASARALAFIAPHDMNCTWRHDMYVVRSRAPRGGMVRVQALPLLRARLRASVARNAIKSLTSYSGRVLSNFDEASTERILSSLQTSALARTSASIENQLISLWSAVEVLLTEPPPDMARINHYVDLLLPCICLRYVRRQAVAVFDEMMIIYRRRFSLIVSEEKIFPGTDQHTKFAAILLLPDNDDLCKRLLGICSDNPLVRHRLWKLRRDYSTPKAIKESLESHQQRVNWQLRRIYRARNDLVHAGKRPSYLDSIVLNLDEFYRACFGTLVNRANREQEASGIDQLVAEIGIEYKIYLTNMASLRNTNALTTETFRRAVA
jgi:hypothetical protein